MTPDYVIEYVGVHSMTCDYIIKRTPRQCVHSVTSNHVTDRGFACTDLCDRVLLHMKINGTHKIKP